ncbi:3-beta hydroxysteroid dehydrogenase [Marivirga lumbricoides]|uniref:3-beta hydroxysteroid dehydrogenase n=1 Tax=Marivirga lumbricoides TaxID=1046115 RepID=A0A2T4DTX9_9BACT|nr:histidine kinase [Marivirga lumbricoides]GGC48884.1 3-beta hydroxysteroid dehydrogenase [Marivirga lumbricoides]
MKKVVVIGATGFVGSHIVNELVERGFKVTGISRSEKESDNSNLSYVALNIKEVEKLADVIKGEDVIVSAFSPAANKPELIEDFLEGSKAIQQAVKKAAVNRFIIIGGAGSLLNDEGRQIVDTLPQDLPFIPKSKAARDYFEIIKKEEELDWAYFSPALEMNPEISIGRTGNYRLGTNRPVVDDSGKNRMSVEDVAVVIADEIEKPKHHQQQFTAGY